MALPPLIEPDKKRWLFKVTAETSSNAVRDLCLLGYFLGTGCTTLEINRIQVRDVLHKSGKLKSEFAVRGNPSFNGEERIVYLKNIKLRELTQDYINLRVSSHVGLGDHPDHYLGLDPVEALFFTNKGAGFSVVSKTSDKDVITYSCDALNRHLKLLMKLSGIEGASILSGRRTFAVTLKRKGFDVSYIHHLLGNKTLETTTKLLTRDPVDMGRLAAEAF